MTLKKILFYTIIAFLAWHFCGPLPRAAWKGSAAPAEPIQATEDLPAPWTKGAYTISPRAPYWIKALVLSRHHYWAGYDEDILAPYDLALGWGVMSQAALINALKISQDGRWYNYTWKGELPVAADEVVRHSANHHILADNKNVLRKIAAVRRFDVVDLEGFLVDVTKTDGWHWNTSLTREDSGGGACEVFWVKTVRSVRRP